MTCVIWKLSSSACWIYLAFCPGCLSHNNKAGFFSAVVHMSESNGITCSVINYNSVDVFDYRAIGCVVLFHNL